jgi:hypothetical protein
LAVVKDQSEDNNGTQRLADAVTIIQAGVIFQALPLWAEIDISSVQDAFSMSRRLTRNDQFTCCPLDIL